MVVSDRSGLVRSAIMPMPSVNACRRDAGEGELTAKRDFVTLSTDTVAYSAFAVNCCKSLLEVSCNLFFQVLTRRLPSPLDFKLGAIGTVGACPSCSTCAAPKLLPASVRRPK